MPADLYNPQHVLAPATVSPSDLLGNILLTRAMATRSRRAGSGPSRAPSKVSGRRATP